ncbi:MAG: Rpp14/Pop5 family protein [Candidatus Marsarchaeota archaeon]|nr:Rpp14/Pop5 family protein [Candidatus Marsarchaeota archaeon]MCL5094937.1 Rpp14/Pop5 family protein [Candidatus Marsarchaeota archaeon]
MKQRHRYLLIESGFDIIDEKQFSILLSNELMNMLGLNYYKINPKIISFLGQNRFIIKCSGVYVDILILTFTFIKSLNKEPAYFYTLKSSGTIKSIKEQI